MAQAADQTMPDVTDAACTQPAGNCWSTLCCQQPVHAPVYGCFKRNGRSFAQCRPKYGWFNHTEKLTGTCESTDAWTCPEAWLTDAVPDRPVPAERSALPSANVIVQDGYWDYKCSADHTDCTSTECCANPSFGCYKRSGRMFAMCRPKVDNCVDYDWLCPGWERCAGSHGDCTSSLCCRAQHETCHRRPLFYYAQCRTESLPCTPWRERKSITSSDAWLCPGWEECSDNHDECTLSRCCKDPGFSCYLNKTTGTSQSEWYAECRPRPNKTLTATTGANYELGAASAGSTASGGVGGHAAVDAAACGGDSQWVCPAKWMAWRDGIYADYVEPAIKEHPISVVAILLIVLGSLVATCACCIINRRRVKIAMRAAQNEMNEMKLQQEIKKEKKEGGLVGA